MLKRYLSIIFSIGLLFSLVIGCSSEGTDQSANENSAKEEEMETETYPLVLEDAMGEEVTIEERPEKIVSLMPSNTEIVFALEEGEKVVGVTDHDTYPEEVEDIDKIGGLELNVEKIISLQPDVVLAHASASDGLDQIKQADIPVFVVTDADDIETTYESIEEIGTITGAIDEAEAIIQEMKDGFKELEEQASTIKEEDRKSVFMEISPEPEIFTGGNNTFVQALLDIIQADNAAETHDGWLMLDPETIVELNPDVIITTYGYYTEDAEDAVLSRQGWDSVTAIENKEVYDLHADLVNRPGPRLVDGAKELAKIVYPEVFKDEN